MPAWKSLYATHIVLSPPPEEYAIWEEHVAPHLKWLPDNVLQICAYGFTEICNNVIDHSGGEIMNIALFSNGSEVEIRVWDDGVGIFKKIGDALGLGPQDAVLELSKGKLTTDPTRHSGEGIFFSSWMFDIFFITSEQIVFSRGGKSVPEGFSTLGFGYHGTIVSMIIATNSDRTNKQVFDMFSTGDNYAFLKTQIPIRLAMPGDPVLISRSQAKRVLSRCENFTEVTFDFEGVDSIGQAFADELFRVFPNAHPGIKIDYVNTQPDVEKMIKRALSHPNHRGNTAP